MSRIVTTMVVAIAMMIAVPAAATVYETNGADPDVFISLTIGCYTNIYWNNTDDDHEIFFNDTVQDGSNGGDWYSAVLTGAYGAGTKASQDPFATGYFESYDQAFFWIEANCDVEMVVTTGGNLTDGSNTLDSWFTMALTNGTGTADGFISGGVRKSDGTIPLDGMGTYADDADADGTMELFGGAFYPVQHSFAMGPGPKVYTAATGDLGNETYFDAYAQGTVLFHARVLRAGLLDPAGTYTSSLDFTFIEH